MPPEVEPLDSQGVTARQDHAAFSVDGEPADVREQAVLPEDFGVEAALGRFKSHADDRAERRGGDRHGPPGNEAEMRERVHRLESSRGATEAAEEMQRRLPGSDGEIAAVRVDCHERRIGGSCALLLDLEIGIQEKQAGLLGLDEQSDQASIVADRSRVDTVGHARERERLALDVQEIELVSVIPGKDRACLAGEGEPFEGGVGDDGPGGVGFQPSRRPAGGLGHRSLPAAHSAPSSPKVLRSNRSGLMSSRRLGGGET